MSSIMFNIKCMITYHVSFLQPLFLVILNLHHIPTNCPFLFPSLLLTMIIAVCVSVSVSVCVLYDLRHFVTLLCSFLSVFTFLSLVVIQFALLVSNNCTWTRVPCFISLSLSLSNLPNGQYYNDNSNCPRSGCPFRGKLIKVTFPSCN